MRFQRNAFGFSVSLMILIVMLVLPFAGAAAEPASQDISMAAEEIDGGNSFYNPDTFPEDPELQEMQERYLGEIPGQFAPRSLSDKPEDSTKREQSDRKMTGGGAGTWTTFTPANTPNPDPNINYIIDGSSWSNVMDANGVQHTIIGVSTNTDISQAPDGAGFQYANLTRLYHLTYADGAWSAPTPVTSISGFETTSLVLWEFDELGYLHMVYEKYAWGRDASIGAGNPTAYMHTNDNLHYRYMAPDGTWSTPRALTSLTGAYAINGGSVELINNRVYFFILSIFNKETATPSYTTNYIFNDGALDSWNTPVNLAHWDFQTAVGETVPFFTAATFDASVLTGEVTASYGTLYYGAGGPSTYQTNIYAATRNPSGTWSGFQSVAGGVNNEVWGAYFLAYNQNDGNVIMLVLNSLIETTALVPARSNQVIIYHDQDGWHTPVNITRNPDEYEARGFDIIRDPWDRWHFVFSSVKCTWDGAIWDSTGDLLSYTSWSPGDLGGLEVISPYTADRYFDWGDAVMDSSGKVHFVSIVENGAGTISQVYYSDNTDGPWSALAKLSVDSGQEITDIIISTDPSCNTIATWAEEEFTGGGDPVAGAIYSRIKTGDSWSSIQKVTEVPGSSDIMHVVDAGPIYYDVVRDNTIGTQYAIFETSKNNTGPLTYYDFHKYYSQTVNGTWQTPQIITNEDISGIGSLLFDLNTRGHALFETVDAATNDDILYESMQPDTTPPATTYYFAEGTTRSGFQEWLCIQNSGAADANVSITYMLETGENLTQDIPVPAHSRSTVDVNAFVGPEHDVSTLVTSDQLIAAERPMYFDRTGWQGGTAAVGSLNTGRQWYFAEGTTRPGFQEYLTLQNPTGTEAPVMITYMLGDGTTIVQEVTVPGRTRQTVDVNAAVGPDQDVSVKVDSPDTAIVVERPMYFIYHGAWPGGHNSVGTAQLDTRWYFAEGTTLAGFETYLCLQNPYTVAGNATITYILGDGSTQASIIDLPPTSRQTVTVNNIVGADKDVSMIVDSSIPILAERPMYFNYHGFAPGGHVAVGSRTVKNSWYLAEGTTRTGFDEWLSIENAGPETANVTITYIMGDGTTQGQAISVTPHTRSTVDVRSAIGSEKDVSVSIWSDKGILVERPMYFSAGDRRWPGGTNVMGL